MSDAHLALYVVISFVAAILAGICGGGGGFITTPLAILLGLTPQQAIATGKLSGLAISLGTVYGFRKAKLHSWKHVLPLVVLALVIGLAGPHFITQIDNELYRRILGVVLILMIPLVLFKKIGQKKYEPSLRRKVVGYVLIAISLALQAVFSGGMGTLVNLVLMGFLGMTSLEANVTKRYSQIIMNIVLVLGLIGTGLIVWRVALLAIIAALLGGMIGSHIALKKGDKYVVVVFALMMGASGVALLFS